ncbi:MAG: CBS domain-containing protein [Pyrinomonadaceae bacterium]|nr:CBS domain-containing protein [Pyrinomonadaceae bacterium]
MSKYRNDRDDEFYGGRQQRGRGDYGDERPLRREGYERGDSHNYRDDYRADEMSYAPDRERYLGGGRDYDDYGRERSYGGERESYRTDYDTGAVGRRGERGDYERSNRSSGDRDDQSMWERGREMFTGRREARGASRSHVRCRDIMTRDVTVATRDTPLEEVARMMRDEDTGVIPVVERADATAATTDIVATADANTAATNTGNRQSAARGQGNGKLVGLITDRDIVVRAIAEGKNAQTTPAEEIMTTDVHTAQPNDRVIDTIRKMGDKQVRRIPIVDRDQVLRGIISMADVALETNDDRELAEALEEISSGSSFWNRIFG